MKKYIGLLLVVLLLLSLFTACGNHGEFKKTSTNLYFGDTESRDPLRICIDIQTSELSTMEITRAMEELLSAIRTDIGEQDVIIEYIPNQTVTDDSVARTTAISRLRTEIMAGAGPDVFIMTYQKTLGPTGWDMDAGDILFKSPQKVMENGIFLPLDDYIENNTQHTEWDKLPKAIMDAGRNDEGQQIIPLAYTLPVLVYPKEVFDYTPDRLLTWNDMLTDPELAPYATDLINAHGYYLWEYEPEVGDGFINRYLEFSLGEIADYETGELLFTEEELWQHVQEIIALPQEETQSEALEILLGTKTRSSHMQPITLLPMYSDDGGVSTRIEYYAAVNRNTKWPEEAFRVIDVLTSPKMQQGSQIYSTFICNYWSPIYPVYDEYYRQDSSIRMHTSEENYKEFCELREQITSAHFAGEPTALMQSLVEMSIVMPDQAEYIVKAAYEELERRVRE